MQRYKKFANWELFSKNLYNDSGKVESTETLATKRKRRHFCRLVCLAPLSAQFSNQLFEDFKKLYELKPFINVDSYNGMHRGIKGNPRKDNALDSHHAIKPEGEHRVREVREREKR